MHRCFSSCMREWDGVVDLLEVVRVLAEGQSQGVQGMAVVFLSTEEKAQQMEGVQVIPLKR